METSHRTRLTHFSHVFKMTTHKCHRRHECPTPTASCEAESWQGDALQTWKDVHRQLDTSLVYFLGLELLEPFSLLLLVTVVNVRTFCSSILARMCELIRKRGTPG